MVPTATARTELQSATIDRVEVRPQRVAEHGAEHVPPGVQGGLEVDERAGRTGPPLTWMGSLNEVITTQ